MVVTRNMKNDRQKLVDTQMIKANKMALLVEL